MKKKNFLCWHLLLLHLQHVVMRTSFLMGKNGTDVTNSDGDAWVALSVQSTKTRALNNPNQENGTPDESTITKVYAVFF